MCRRPEKDDEEAYGKPEPLREAPYGEGRSLREGPALTERAGVPYGPLQKEGRRRGLRPLRRENPLRGRTLTGKEGPEGQGLLQPFPELGGNFRLCAVDQKRPFFPRAGPFLVFLPFKEAYGKAGPLREAPYGEGRSLREGPVLTGESLTRIGREFPLVCRRPKKAVFS